MSYALAGTMPASAPAFIDSAFVGGVPDAGPVVSPLIGLLVFGETAELATVGDNGSALFTSTRLLVAERAGIITKRLKVKALRRDAICAYTIDPDTIVTLTLQGPSFGTALLMFEENFDPMQLSIWLGETLAGPLN